MKKIRLTKRLWLIIALVVIIVAALFIHNNPHIILSSIRLFNSDYDTNSITFEKADYYGFEKMDNQIAVAYTDSVKIYDDKLEEKHSINMAGSAPVVKTAGKNMLVFYPAEKKAVVKIKDTEYKINTDYYILNGTVNKDGYFALVTEEKGFKAMVTVYDDKNKEIYKWHSADCYIADVDISDDSKTMAVNAVAATEAGIESKVMLFSFTDSKPFSEIVPNGVAVYEASFLSNNRLAVIGDKKTGIYNTDGTLIREEDYSSNQLFSYNASGDNIILATGDTASATENVSVKIYSSSGRLKGEYVHSGEVLGIDVTDNGILVYGKRNVVLISDGGREKRSVELNVDVLKAFLFDDEKTVFVVSNSVGKIYYLR